MRARRLGMSYDGTGTDVVPVITGTSAAEHVRSILEFGTRAPRDLSPFALPAVAEAVVVTTPLDEALTRIEAGSDFPAFAQQMRDTMLLLEDEQASTQL